MIKPFLLILLILTAFFSLNAIGQNPSSNQLNCKVTINGIAADNITKQQFQNATSLQVDSPGLTITSFEFSVYQKNKKPVVLRNSKSGAFTEEMQTRISTCTTGSKVFIEYIKCVDKNNDSHFLSPLSITIK